MSTHTTESHAKACAEEIRAYVRGRVGADWAMSDRDRLLHAAAILEGLADKSEAARPAVRMTEWLGSALRTLVNVLSLDNNDLDTLYGTKITAQEALNEGQRAIEAWVEWRRTGKAPDSTSTK